MKNIVYVLIAIVGVFLTFMLHEGIPHDIGVMIVGGYMGLGLRHLMEYE